MFTAVCFNNSISFKDLMHMRVNWSEPYKQAGGHNQRSLMYPRSARHETHEK